MALGTRLQFERPSDDRSAGLFPAVAESLHDAIDRGVNYLLSLQASEGYWLGELEADTTLESDYIFYLNVIGKARPDRIAKLANYVRRRQLEDGGWNIYHGGPSELNATVKAYVALRLAGDSPDSDHLRRACRRVHELGGLEASNSYSRLYLALVGAVGWDMVPAVPPELMLLPNWFAINIYEMSSWTRGIVIPLTILYARKPCITVPGGVSVDALYKDPSRKALAFDWDRQLFSWRNFFLALDRGFKLYERIPWKPLRNRALRQARDWLLAKQIFGPGDWMVKARGVMPGGWAFAFRNDFFPDVDDTAFVLMALQRVDYPDKPRMEAATRRGLAWLLAMQTDDGGWGAFDHNNDRQFLCQIPFADHNAMIDPSTADVTARVVECLGWYGWPANHPAIERAVKFLLKDQTEEGPWFGRWGVNYVYGTSGVLRALDTIALTARGYCQQAVEWLRRVQNSDGGFGE